MFTTKKFGMLSFVTIMALTFTFPAGDVLAANSKANTYSLMNSIFDKVGLKMPKPGSGGSKGEENPGDNSQNEESSDSDATSPGEAEKPDETTPEKPETDKPESENGDASTAVADKIIATGAKYIGTPYQFGAASGQTNTFDCSSFTQYIFKQHGIDLPRSSRQQYQVGTPVDKSQLKKGDLLFFRTSSSGSQIGHVAVYAGNNQVLHTWGSKGVQFESLDTKWLQAGYVGAKRVLSQ